MTTSAYLPPTTWTLHTLSGAVAQVPSHLLEHPIFGQYLVEVAPFSKSYHPEMWKPTTADEYLATQNHADENTPNNEDQI